MYLGKKQRCAALGAISWFQGARGTAFRSFSRCRREVEAYLSRYRYIPTGTYLVTHWVAQSKHLEYGLASEHVIYSLFPSLSPSRTVFRLSAATFHPQPLHPSTLTPSPPSHPQHPTLKSPPRPATNPPNPSISDSSTCR